uniref:Uncharacterized protein n=1 Tax=Panagrolaimus sp. JU765 TaxID=591449 RepID=A0AC34Q209_9BILA
MTAQGGLLPENGKREISSKIKFNSPIVPEIFYHGQPAPKFNSFHRFKRSNIQLKHYHKNHIYYSLESGERQ